MIAIKQAIQCHLNSSCFSKDNVSLWTGALSNF